MSTDKSSKEGKMQSSISPRDALSRLVQPRAFDTRERWLEAVARKAGISYRAAKGIFYGEIKDPEHRAFRRVTDTIKRAERAGAEHDALVHDSAAILARAHRLQAELDRVSQELAEIRSALVRNGALPGR
jgi:hypothetical protein